jgi:hypothetical protein
MILLLLQDAPENGAPFSFPYLLNKQGNAMDRISPDSSLRGNDQTPIPWVIASQSLA